ncbi:MAG: PqqD family protein [Acidobacteriia bacterium]|nr:PqqD family protein [Terriglobia bacterium]
MNDTRYMARSAAIASRPLGDETMVMSAASSTLFTLDEIATLLWESADGVTPLDEIVRNKICARYDIPPDVALRDAENFIQQLAGHGILLISDKPLAAANSSPRETR